MPLIWKSCSLRGVGYRKLASEFAAAKHLPHHSNRAKYLSRLECLETSMNTEILSLHTTEAVSMALVHRIHKTKLYFYMYKIITEKKIGENECLSSMTQALQWFRHCIR